MTRSELAGYFVEIARMLTVYGQRFARIRDLHSPLQVDAEQVCGECFKPWPCPTCLATTDDHQETADA